MAARWAVKGCAPLARGSMRPGVVGAVADRTRREAPRPPIIATAETGAVGDRTYSPVPEPPPMSNPKTQVKRVAVPLLFGRPRHFHHPEMAANHLRLRGRHLHRRPRPGRGTGAGAAQGRSTRRQARAYLHRGRPRGVRSQLRSFRCFRRQRALRGAISAGHLDRAAADRQTPGRRRAKGRRRCDRPRRDRQGQRSGAIGTSAPTRCSPTSRSSRPGANGKIASRTALFAFAEENRIPIAKDKRGEAPFSTDANLLHVSSEGKVLEDPAQETPHYVYSRTVDPASAPDEPTVVEIAFEKGDPVASTARGCRPRRC